MSITKKVSKNVAFLTLAEGVTRGCAILLFIYVARVLGVTSLGELAFATSVISFFTFFADFGLTTLGIREIARHKKETERYGTTILLFQVLVTFLLLVLLAILLLFIPISYTLKAITFLYGLGLIPLALDMSYLFEGHEKMEYVLVGKAITQGVYFLVGLALITLFKNIIFVPVAALISGMAGALVTYALLQRVLHFQLNKLDLKTFTLLIRAAIPFVTSEILLQIYRNIDIVLLQFSRSTNEIGYYSSGYKIVNSLILLISLISTSFFPLISWSFKHDKSQFKQAVLLFSQITGLLSIPLAIGGMMYARNILTCLYGTQLAAGTDAFKVLLLLVIVVPFRLVVVSIAVASDKQNQYMISGAIGTIINGSLNLLLTPNYGIMGAAIAIVVTEIGVTIYLIINCFKLFEYSRDILKNYFLKPTLAAILMILAAFHVPNIFVGIPLIVLVYLVALYLIKGFPQQLPTSRDGNLALLKQQPWVPSDQLATASLEPGTPSAYPTNRSLMKRPDSLRTVFRQEVLQAAPVSFELLTRGDQSRSTLAVPATQSQTERVSHIIQPRKDQMSHTPALSQKEAEPPFFFVSEARQADMNWPEWLKSMGVETTTSEAEPQRQELPVLLSPSHAQQLPFDLRAQLIDRTPSEADEQQPVSMKKLENDSLSQCILPLQPGSPLSITQKTSLSSLLAQSGHASPEPVKVLDLAPPTPASVLLSLPESGRANLFEQVSAFEMPALATTESMADPGSNGLHVWPVPRSHAVEMTPKQLFEPVADQEVTELPILRAEALLKNNLETTIKRPSIHLHVQQTVSVQANLSQHPGQGHLADGPTTDNVAKYTSSKARLIKGYRSQLAGAYDDAMQEYRILIRNSPELLDEVISNLRALLKLIPTYSMGYRVLGDAYMHQGEYLQAMEAYKKAPTGARSQSSRRG